MAPLTLVVGRDPTRLLEEAARGFLAPLSATPSDPFPSPGYLLALRQGGIRDDLIGLAAARGLPGWFDPPLCTFHELPNWLGSTGRRVCGDFARAALLARVIRQGRGPVLGRARRLDDFLDAVEHLFGELIAEGVTPDAYAEAVSRVEQHDDFERARDAELVESYRRYCDGLERTGLRDGRDSLVDCASAVRSDPEGLARRMGGRRELRVFGLHDLRGGWRVLLQALRDCPGIQRVIMYGADDLDFGPEIEVERVVREDSDSTATRLFTDRGVGAAHFEVIDAPNTERELGEVARRVRDLADRGVPLDRIAVVARQARPYVDLVLRALRRFGVPATARRRFSYQEIPAVRAVLTFFAAAADGWSRPVLVELADQPYFDIRLDSRVINLVGFRRVTRGLDAWRVSLEALERETREVEGGKGDGDHSSLSTRQVAEARAAFTAFAERAAELDRSRPLGEWIDWLAAFLVADPWQIEHRIYEVPEERYDIAKRDLAGWRGLSRILEEWREAAEQWGGGQEHMSPGEFHGRLREMLAGEVALWTETRRGVRVLEGLAAAYRAFDHVFLVGMEAGRFPVDAPSSAVLDESDRAALAGVHLPLDRRTDWDGRERSLFRILVAGARAGLTVSFPRLNALGQETIRSAFVEALTDAATAVPAAVDPVEVLTPGMPLYRGDGVADHAYRMAAMERERRTGVLGPHNGQVTSPDLLARLSGTFGDDRVWSPTELEEYAKCPWAYFSNRVLKLEQRDDPDEEMDATVRGRIFHAALARFYDLARARIEGPVLLRMPDLAWVEPMLAEAMDDTVRTYADSAGLGHPVLWGARRQELERVLVRYLRWEVQHNEDMHNTRKQNAPKVLRTAVLEHERRFDPVVLDRGGVRLCFRGVVDRVEVGIDERITDPERFLAAVDYKTTVAGTPGGGDPEAWNDDVVLQGPLYAYALTQLYAEGRACRVEYRSLRSPGRVHALELQQVDKKTHIRFADPASETRLARALDAAVSHVSRMRLGEFPARPAPSCKCPPFCHAWDICRVAGGPQTKRQY